LATLGSDFSVKKFGPNDENVVQIWDLAGQPRSSLVRETYYLGTRGVILVYDITRPDSFYSIPN
jgi:GTPase SAR1 family protein